MVQEPVWVELFVIKIKLFILMHCPNAHEYGASFGNEISIVLIIYHIEAELVLIYELLGFF